MNNNQAILKTLVVYLVCVPLAIWLGFLLTSPLTYSTLGLYGTVIAMLFFPFILRWHYPFMLLTWNTVFIIIFLPGHPTWGMAAIAISFCVSILQRTVDKKLRFINVMQITLPLIFMAVVALVTAKLTGGFGLRSFGSEVYGGKKYITLILGILGYFALSCRQIPLKRAKLYVGLFFLGGATSAISDLYLHIPNWLNFIFYIVPTNVYVEDDNPNFVARLGGAWIAGFSIFCFMLARYGLRGIFLEGKPWRWMLLSLVSCYSLLSGFRGFLVVLVLAFAIQFYLEGLHRTKLLPIFAIVALLGMLLLFPFVSYLPDSVQRTVSFLPLNVTRSVKMDAEGSAEWRYAMWKALWPEVPQYLLLGKGYAFDRLEYMDMVKDTVFKAYDPGQQGLALAGDYHNGPLSVLIPFGIWGAIAYVWFLAAGIRVLYCNFKYGDPALKTVNTLLLSLFVTRTLFFFFIFGAMNSDTLVFAGWLGLSVALNGGVCKSATQQVAEQAERQFIPIRSRQFQPALHER